VDAVALIATAQLVDAPLARNDFTLSKLDEFTS